MNMELNNLLQTFMKEHTTLYGKWHDFHKETCEYMINIYKSLQNGKSLEDSILLNKDDNLGINDLESFYDHFWKKTSNGISNIGQGFFSSKDYILIKKYKYNNCSFLQLNEAIILDPENEYEKTIEWFSKCKEECGTKLYKASINRFFSALLPEKLTTIANDSCLNMIIERLGLEITEKNWIERNKELIALLPEPDDNFDIYSRGEFFWYYYENIMDTEKKSNGVELESYYKEIAEKIISTACNWNNVEVKETPQYLALKTQAGNFCEVHTGLKKVDLNLSDIFNEIPSDTTAKTGLLYKRVPDSHQWTLNTIVTITKKEQVDEAIKLLELSMKFVDSKVKQKNGNVSNNNNSKSIIEQGLEQFSKFVRSRGFNFDDELLANYMFSLKSKPFVILSGISGTGKTKIAQLFAEFMCPDEIIEDIEAPEEDEFIYKVYKYFIKYSRIVLPNKIADLIITPISENNKEINVKVDNIKGKCWFGYANNQNKAKQILFSGEIAKYIKNNIKVDDYLKIYIENANDTETIVFEKINPEKKVITKKSNRYCFLSVRPDWNDNRSLLGFYNLITETYQPTELLKLILRAIGDKNNPYFVILDEMNLAKVEHYFSDFLSCLESRRINEKDCIISEKIILHDSEDELKFTDEDGKEYVVPKRIEIPLNIYFTGTINVDETTYMFSPKVLDRANVIEFNEVDMEDYRNKIFHDEIRLNEISINKADKVFINYFTDNGHYCKRLIQKAFNQGIEEYYNTLMKLNGILLDYHMHFGYRVIDEIMMYLSYGYEFYKDAPVIDIDLQILQKVLPKIHGNRKQLEILLARLLRFCFNADYKNIDKVLTSEEKKIAFTFDYKQQINEQYGVDENSLPNDVEFDFISEEAESIFPRTAKKICRMIDILDKQGYTSFIE